MGWWGSPRKPAESFKKLSEPIELNVVSEKPSFLGQLLVSLHQLDEHQKLLFARN